MYIEESSNYTESEKRHPLLNKIEDVKFIAVNFNSDPHLNKLNKYKENAPPTHYFNEMKKPV